MKGGLQRRLEAELEQFIRDGVYKRLNFLESPQDARVRMEERGEVIILSSNNYLGLSNQPEVIAAGKQALDRYGAGTASVRFICGTFTIHRALEAACARLVGTGASLSFVSAWSANEAVPATLLGEEDIVISDQLNHASIIDAVRLAKSITKCQSAVYRHADLADLKERLTNARDRRVRLVITDGVFSMEGAIAPLPDLVELCRQHDAVLMVDDSHGTGVLGALGVARPSISIWWARSTSSPPPWARRWEALPAGSSRRLPQHVTTSRNERDPSSFPTLCPPRSLGVRLPASSISKHTQSGCDGWGRMRAISGSDYSSWDSSPCRVRPPSFQSSWEKLPRRSG